MLMCERDPAAEYQKERMREEIKYYLKETYFQVFS
jgi:hypothetical protein